MAILGVPSNIQEMFLRQAQQSRPMTPISGPTLQNLEKPAQARPPEQGFLEKLMQNPGITQALARFGQTALVAGGRGLSTAEGLGLGLGASLDTLEQARKEERDRQILESQAAQKAQQQLLENVLNIAKFDASQQKEQRLAATAPLIKDPVTGKMMPNPDLLMFEQAKAAAGAPRVSVQVGAEGEFTKKRAGGFATQLTEMETRAIAAPARLGRLESLQEQLISGTPTGAMQEMTLGIQTALQDVGFDVENVAEKELFAAYTTQEIIPRVKQLGVNPTDKDFQNIVKASAGLGKDEASNLVLLDAEKKLIDRENELVNLMGQMEAQGATVAEMRNARNQFIRERGKLDIISLEEAKKITKPPQEIPAADWFELTLEERLEWYRN